LAHFWPADVVTIDYESEFGQFRVAGEIVQREFIGRDQYMEASSSASQIEGDQAERWMLKSGNRKIDAPDFRWVYRHEIVQQVKDRDMIVFERSEWGNAYGTLVDIKEQGRSVAPDNPWGELQDRIERVSDLRDQSRRIQKGSINRINYRLEKLRLEKRNRELKGIVDHSDLENEREQLNAEYGVEERRLREITNQLDRDEIEIQIADGRVSTIPMRNVIRAWQPNEMSLWSKLGHYFSSIWIFLSQESREANTEGGVFPALFGTVLMVLLMSVLVTPFGVIAALYLREYAKQGPFVQLIRIAVNNLAGVPSIVYGVFGLGFFVYLVGGSIDDLFFKAAQPAPTFGTPGLMWASLTLALLTVPVVIVSTEEGLTRIPSELREGSLALGATKAETMFKIILPMASPSILTGIILAIARAAGEVAPLMLVGVVKLAPTLPIDGNFPFLHLDRKFMHLGFHIYDLGFQSPNVDAARPLVFATAFLLVLIIVALNLTAITLRNRLEARYRGAML
ncbi:MAG: phosphate ABC transporter permease PstA, partial [Gammaproteobacteria bacterium]|nr:phosphate ABC transporter permease PstA [Gammaproteobacteria bacterium]